MLNKIKNNYNHTIYACYIAYIVQAIVNNFAPLLFITFATDYQLSLDKIGYRKALVFGHACAAGGWEWHFCRIF